MQISASQLGTFRDCRRKWWFQKTLKLYGIPDPRLSFGTAMHAVLERWLSATDTGRVPEHGGKGPLADQEPGAAVNLYPEGWEHIDERGLTVTLTKNEQALIRDLADRAIESGIVERRPGRAIEREFLVDVIEGIQLKGFADVCIPGEDGRPAEIHDHKTFGPSSGRYLKRAGPIDEERQPIVVTEPWQEGDGTKPNSVVHDEQLLTYAAAVCLLDAWDGDIVVRHNQLPRFPDAKGPRFAEGVVSAGRALQHWEQVKAEAVEMRKVSGIERWQDAPLPEEPGTCSKYGGCPFLEICQGRITPEQYQVERERTMQRMQNTPRPNVPLGKFKESQQGATRMGLLSNPTKKQEAAAPAPQINGGTPAPASAPVDVTQSGPPWAKPDCPACKGTGFNTADGVCRICDATAGVEGRPTSSMYNVVNSDGTRCAVVKDDFASAVEGLGVPAEWAAVHRETIVVPNDPKPEPAAASEPVPAPEPTPEPAESEPAPEPAEESKSTKARKPRSRKGFTLMIGCVQVKGPKADTLLLSDLFHELTGKLAKAMGQDEFYELETWVRKDRLKQLASRLEAEELGRKQILVQGPISTDMQYLLEGLMVRPDCDAIIRGMSS